MIWVCRDPPPSQGHLQAASILRQVPNCPFTPQIIKAREHVDSTYGVSGTVSRLARPRRTPYYLHKAKAIEAKR